MNRRTTLLVFVTALCSWAFVWGNSGVSEQGGIKRVESAGGQHRYELYGMVCIYAADGKLLNKDRVNKSQICNTIRRKFALAGPVGGDLDIEAETAKADGRVKQMHVPAALRPIPGTADEKARRTRCSITVVSYKDGSRAVFVEKGFGTIAYLDSQANGLKTLDSVIFTASAGKPKHIKVFADYGYIAAAEMLAAAQRAYKKGDRSFPVVHAVEFLKTVEAYHNCKEAAVRLPAEAAY
jgi:hypothetical protein